MGSQEPGDPHTGCGKTAGALGYPGQTTFPDFTLSCCIDHQRSLFLTFFLHHLQVTTLVNSSNKGPSNKKKGRSKKAHVLAASVETATQNFLEKGEKIAKESQFLKDELTAAVEDVRKQGMQKREVFTRVGLTV